MPSAADVVSLLGKDLRKPDGTTVPTSDALKGKGVLALYFSAHWCPPCRGFTPTLCKKYKALQDAGKEFEMVFVSSDRDEDAFKEYHGEMPFMALPYVRRTDKQALSELFDVSGIPTLVLVDLATNKTITTSGRGPISSSTFIEDFPYYPKPVNDFGESLEGINDEPSLVVFMQSSSADKKKELLATLNKIAVAQFKKPEKEWEVSRFFTANQEGPVAKVRSLCKMETVLTAHEHPSEKSDENSENVKKATKKPAADMVILDLENGQFFRCEATEVTEDSIRAFMKDFKQGNALGVSIR